MLELLYSPKPFAADFDSLRNQNDLSGVHGDGDFFSAAPLGALVW